MPMPSWESCFSPYGLKEDIAAEMDTSRSEVAYCIGGNTICEDAFRLQFRKRGQDLTAHLTATVARHFAGGL